MRAAWAITKRELKAYFATPLAYVFIVIFLVLAGALTFFAGGFLGRGQADLVPFFGFLPWLFLFLVPAVAMRLWAEERRTGTIELLLTLPMPPGAAVIGKFLAAWAFVAVALALTFPLWITVAYLGEPDNGTILAGYVGSLLLAGAYLAVGSAVSAATKNQVIAFVVAAAICFLFTVAGSEIALGLVAERLPPGVLGAVSGFSFLAHFEAIQRGVIDLRDAVFYGSTILAALATTRLVLELRKAE